MNLQQDIDWQWLAGFFDGEGCVHIQEMGLGPKNKTVRYQARVLVAQKCIPLLENIKHFLGYGYIYVHESTCPNLSIPSKKILHFLMHILPYLQVKRLQARLMLQFLKYRKKGCAEHPPSKRELQWQKMHEQLIRKKNFLYLN